MELSPYLQLNGNAREAIEFYENTFGAKNLGIMTYGIFQRTQVFHFLKYKRFNFSLSVGNREFENYDCRYVPRLSVSRG